MAASAFAASDNCSDDSESKESSDACARLGIANVPLSMEKAADRRVVRKASFLVTALDGPDSSIIFIVRVDDDDGGASALHVGSAIVAATATAHASADDIVSFIVSISAWTSEGRKGVGN